MNNKLRINPISFGNLFESFINNDFPYLNENRLQVPAAVNIIEHNDSYSLQLIAPGLNKSDFDIKVDKNMLSISYEQKENKQDAEEKRLRQEFVIKSFKRQFNLHEKIDAQNIQANYINGILEITLAKREKEEPKTIAISVQ